MSDCIPVGAATAPTQSPSSGGAPLLLQLSGTLVPELKRYMEHHRSRVCSMVTPDGLPSGGPLAHAYASMMDGLFCSLLHATKAAMQRDDSWHEVAIGAVGTYGRRSLTPYSDIDVHILCQRLNKAAPIAKALLYPLWNIGISVSHQVIVPRDTIALARKDLPTATALLDWRYLAGSRELAQEFRQRATREVFGLSRITAFLERLEHSALERHRRYGTSVYLLEPDVKNGVGGLRDLDIATWAAKARWGVEELEDLVGLGVLLPAEWDELRRARELLTIIRLSLHELARRRSDRLAFDRQEILAERFGCGKGGPGVEAFMGRYYQAAQLIDRSRQMILQRAVPPPRRRPKETLLPGGFKRIGEFLGLAGPEVLEQRPAAALELYYDAVVRYDLEVHPSARQLVTRATTDEAFCARLRADPEAAHLFVQLACIRRRTRLKHGSILPELHDVGLLLAMIPEFRPVVGRVHHDMYHVYTVDAHSIAAVSRLRELCRGDLVGEYALACRLAAEIARPRVLFLAVLLHDIGKDAGGSGHPERGAELVDVILTRLGLPPADIEEVKHLILKHLRMYHVATRRDIDDPSTVGAFSAEVHGREGLRELYLLTIADVSTTSPTSMTSWKARMLEDLYVSAHHHLSEGARRWTAARFSSALERVLGCLPSNFDRDFAERFLSTLPDRYLYANDPEKILKHLELAASARTGTQVAILDINEPYVELGIVTNDAPGLLARIAAAFSATKMKVLGAQIYTWADPSGVPRVLDMFWVRCGTESDMTRRQLTRLRRNLELVVDEGMDPFQLLGEPKPLSRRPTPAVEHEVTVDPRAGSRHTIIEVITRDRPELLFRLAHTLHTAGCVIDLAKINTEGERVADVFYVTNPDGSKVTEPAKLEALNASIQQTLAGLEG